MEDFDEIAQGGFRIEYSQSPNGGFIVQIIPTKSTGPITRLPVVAVKVIVNGEGTVIEMGSYPNSPFLRTHATYLVSDRAGLFGRMCPSCKCYFRTNCLYRKKLICPYCAWSDTTGAFVTENQKKFMQMCCQAGYEAMTKGITKIFDTSEAIKSLPNNKPAWAYSERNQQRTFTCKQCKEFNVPIVFNILGEYGNCPSCGKRNYFEVFESKLKLLETQFLQKDSSIKDKHLRGEEWRRLLSDLVALLESLANDVRDQLLKFPATPKRRKNLENVSFQRILNAHECLSNWYGIKILEGIAQDDIAFLNKMFNRRHLVVHTGSRVDEEYLTYTDDSTVSLNQTIRVESNQIKCLIPLISRIGINLISDYNSMKTTIL